MITEPGFYPDMPIAEYHSDPCPSPSLTQSLAKVILDKSALHAWHAHPRLNPAFERNDAVSFDLGNAAHAMLIGRGKTIVPLPFNDWRKTEAKEARELCAARGQQAVLQSQYDRASEMVAAALEQLDERGLSVLFNSEQGNGELVMAWQEDGVWFRQMIDWLSPAHLTFCDFKTTDQTAAPQHLGRLMTAAGWPIQSAMAQRGLDVLSPDKAGRWRYLFVVQETFEPYALQVCEISGAVMTMGRKMLDTAAGIWIACVRSGMWPAYPTLIQRPEMPAWAESQWLARELDSET